MKIIMSERTGRDNNLIEGQRLENWLSTKNISPTQKG